LQKYQLAKYMTRHYAVRLLRQLFYKWPVSIYAFHATLVAASLVLGWLLRFDFSLPERRVLLIAGLLLVVVRLITLRLFNLHRGWWHFASVSDVINILKAVAFGSIIFILIWSLFGVVTFPRAVYVLEAVFTACFLAGTRLGSRALVESGRHEPSRSKRVMVVGAGFAAQMVIRELARPNSKYSVIGCLDDDESKIGIRIQGVPVLGTIGKLEALSLSNAIDEHLIAIPSASGKQMRRITDACQSARLPYKTVPTLNDILRGEATVNELREVRLEDLLGRESAQIRLDTVRNEIADRAVLVTGAAGSIGSELCRQILDYGPSELICLDQNETGLYFLRMALLDHANGSGLTFCVADVCDGERMRRLLQEFSPEVIFHAAAYKHVPMMESNVHEAVKNNVLGFANLLILANESGCSSFVLISSDKAVNPTSVMGATKRICELIISSKPLNVMRCVSVRFGNVLGSSGSVVPVLKQQLRDHKPLTITHPDITRFFMTMPEAVALLLQAFVIGEHGDILVLDMGEPVRILDLAHSLIRLSGRSEDEVEIQFTGLRDGEKLNEQLFYEHEQVTRTSCFRIKRTHASMVGWATLNSQLDELRISLTTDGDSPIRAKIKEIVPEYSFCEDKAGEDDKSLAEPQLRA
jgi:FlaA1/EpsC-like NDP-sugar epimerase